MDRELRPLLDWVNRFQFFFDDLSRYRNTYEALEPLSDYEDRGLANFLKSLRGSAESLGMDMTTRYIGTHFDIQDKVITQESAKGVAFVTESWTQVDYESREELAAKIKSLEEIVRIEVRDLWFLPVETGFMFANLFGERPFSEEAMDAFPSAELDMKEAARCYMLGRWFGAVFHGMRVVERALKSVYTVLNIAAPNAGTSMTWGALLNKIYPLSGADKREGDKTKQETVAMVACISMSALKHIRDKRIMHVDDTLPTVGDAQKMYHKIVEMTDHLAQHIDENGLKE